MWLSLNNTCVFVFFSFTMPGYQTKSDTSLLMSSGRSLITLLAAPRDLCSTLCTA